MTNETETFESHSKKEKRNWFNSLSRRRKPSKSGSRSLPNTDADEPLTPMITNQPDRKRKDEQKNVFQKIRKYMGLRFSIRQKKSSHEGTSSSVVEQNVEQSTEQIVSKPKMVPFSRYYRSYADRKWLGDPLQPNHAMHTACCDMLDQVWYWGEISRNDAQRQLKDKPVGSFLIRDSERGGPSSCWYTLSFRSRNLTLHHRLEFHDNNWHFLSFQYTSIVDMINAIVYMCTNADYKCFVGSRNEVEPPMLAVLKYPISRYVNIMKLQDLCRRVIRRHILEEQVKELQIPNKLQEYLCEKTQLVFQSL